MCGIWGAPMPPTSCSAMDIHSLWWHVSHVVEHGWDDVLVDNIANYSVIEHVHRFVVPVFQDASRQDVAVASLYAVVGLVLTFILVTVRKFWCMLRSIGVKKRTDVLFCGAPGGGKTSFVHFVRRNGVE